MRDVAIISAAGYKALGEGCEFEVPWMCPEPLLPIGREYGGTIVGRLGLQLKALGFTVFITVGRPGCKFPFRVGKSAERYKYEVHPDCINKSPWTWERLEQVRAHGTPVLVDDPDDYSYHDSFCQAIDAIGYNWDRLFMSCGDHLYTDALLGDLMGLATPRQVRAARGREFTFFWLNPSAARLYRRLAEEHRQPTKHGWNGRNAAPTGWSPDGAELASVVSIAYVEEVFPERTGREFSFDADSPRAYRKLLERWLPLYG